MAAVVEARNGRSQNRSSGGKKENSSTSSNYKKPRKAIIESDEEEENVPAKILDLYPTLNQGSITYTMDTDISQLEAPTFTTLDRGPSKTMLNLQWDHPVNLIGKKVVNPMIHCCDTCLRPVLIYGRMIPCKHVFCLSCATTQASKCTRCGDKVTRIEPVGLGAIYMCSQGGTRYGNSGCKRTYLSQRDLQAHVQHRHMKGVAVSTNDIAITTTTITTSSSSATKDMRTASQSSVNFSESLSSVQDVYRTSGGYPPSAPQTYGHPPPSHISVIGGCTRSSNLITVPIQDTSSRRDGSVNQSTGHNYPYGPVTTSNANYSHPPPGVSSTQFFPNPTQTSASFGENGQNPQWRTNQSNFYRR